MAEEAVNSWVAPSELTSLPQERIAELRNPYVGIWEPCHLAAACRPSAVPPRGMLLFTMMHDLDVGSFRIPGRAPLLVDCLSVHEDGGLERNTCSCQNGYHGCCQHPTSQNSCDAMEIDGNCTLAQCGCSPVDIEALDAGGTVKEAWKANKQSDASKLLVDPSTERRRMVSVLMKLPADLLSMPFFDPHSFDPGRSLQWCRCGNACCIMGSPLLAGERGLVRQVSLCLHPEPFDQK